jgi:hypothetical protein
MGPSVRLDQIEYRVIGRRGSECGQRDRGGDGADGD